MTCLCIMRSSDSLNITTNQWPNTAVSGEDLNAETLNNIGVALYDQGKYDEAVKAFDKAIEINPQYEAAWVGKGTTLGSQGKYDEAVAKAFDRAIEINPQYADAWAGKGFALQLLGRN